MFALIYCKLYLLILYFYLTSSLDHIVLWRDTAHAREITSESRFCNKQWENTFKTSPLPKN